MRDDQIGGILHSLRQRRRLSMERLAEMAGISLATISTVERGLRSPRWNTVSAMLHALNADWAVLDGRCEHEFICRFCGVTASQVASEKGSENSGTLPSVHPLAGSPSEATRAAVPSDHSGPAATPGGAGSVGSSFSAPPVTGASGARWQGLGREESLGAVGSCSPATTNVARPPV